jgi:hypothetical protein
MKIGFEPIQREMRFSANELFQNEGCKEMNTRVKKC